MNFFFSKKEFKFFENLGLFYTTTKNNYPLFNKVVDDTPRVVAKTQYDGLGYHNNRHNARQNRKEEMAMHLAYIESKKEKYQPLENEHAIYLIKYAIKNIETYQFTSNDCRGFLLFFLLSFSLFTSLKSNPPMKEFDIETCIRKIFLKDPLDAWYVKNKLSKKDDEYERYNLDDKTFDTIRIPKIDFTFKNRSFNEVNKVIGEVQKLVKEKKYVDAISKFLNISSDYVKKNEYSGTNETIMFLYNISFNKQPPLSGSGKNKTKKMVNNKHFLPTSERVLLNGTSRRIVYKQNGKGTRYVKVRGGFVKLTQYNHTKL